MNSSERRELALELTEEALKVSEPVEYGVFSNGGGSTITDPYLGITVIQERPYTGVALTAYLGERYTAVGHSKVCFPDTWDEQRGLATAIKRAARKIARQVQQERNAETEQVAISLALG